MKNNTFKVNIKHEMKNSNLREGNEREKKRTKYTGNVNLKKLALTLNNK